MCMSYRPKRCSVGYKSRGKSIASFVNEIECDNPENGENAITGSPRAYSPSESALGISLLKSLIKL